MVLRLVRVHQRGPGGSFTNYRVWLGARRVDSGGRSILGEAGVTHASGTGASFVASPYPSLGRSLLIVVIASGDEQAEFLQRMSP